MSHCVPTWDFDDGPFSAAASSAAAARPSMPLDYEVAELAWEDGQIVTHSLGPSRMVPKSPPPSSSPSPWDKPCSAGTLESIVNQATTRLPNPRRVYSGSTVPVCGSATVTVDALVPSNTVPGLETGKKDEIALVAAKRVRVAAERSVTGSATIGRDHSRRRMTKMDPYDMDVGTGFTSTSNIGSPENTTSYCRPCTKTTAAADDRDSVCHSRPEGEGGDEKDKKKRVAGKSPVSTKRSRAAAIHNQSERKRRDKINKRMEILQKLVPNSSKTDKASILDGVIEYLKQLQAQVNMMMSRFYMPSPMMYLPMPPSMQHHHHQLNLQLQMPSSNPIGLLNNSTNPFMPNIMPTDPMPAFLACSSQPIMTMEAYSRMAATSYQQMQPQPPQPSTSKY